MPGGGYSVSSVKRFSTRAAMSSRIKRMRSMPSTPRSKGSSVSHGFDGAAGLAFHQCDSHLGLPTVLDAHEQDGGLVTGRGTS